MGGGVGREGEAATGSWVGEGGGSRLLRMEGSTDKGGGCSRDEGGADKEWEGAAVWARMPASLPTTPSPLPHDVHLVFYSRCLGGGVSPCHSHRQASEVAVLVVAAPSPTQSRCRRAPRNALADAMADLQVQPARTVEITDTEEIIHIGEDVRAAKEKHEAHIREIDFKIHRFPANLRGFGRDMDYIAPRIVAIGPYYHGVPELQAMEEVKRMAAYYFCEGLDQSPEEVYKKIVPVARDVRGCYADADKLAGITDDDFAAMMFFDGCFLVQCMVSLFSGEQSLLVNVFRSKGRSSIVRDMLLLENQIPWPVLRLLTALRPVPVARFIVGVISNFRVNLRRGQQHFIIDVDFKPPHLLGLIHFYQVRSRESVPEEATITLLSRKKKKGLEELTVTTSAAELAEIGVKLTSSGTTQFSDMKFARGPLFATLSLAPLLLGDLSACSLVNMAAFEQCTGTSWETNYPVNSYLSVMAQLMNRDDDVRELRGKRIVHTFSDENQALKFFNRLAPYLAKDTSYYDILEGLEEYKQKRWVWIAIYKFLYKNAKTIAMVLSIVGVLVGIFKTLFSLKQHPCSLTMCLVPGFIGNGTGSSLKTWCLDPSHWNGIVQKH